MKNKFNERLRILRLSKNLSQKELATDIGYVQTTIAKWEAGDRYPNFDTLIKLADYFEVTIDFILGHDE